MAHHVAPDGSIYVDTAFLNSTRGVRGVTIEHMGFGEFYANTPKGRIDFDRMRGKDFEGQSGRSHKLYGDRGAPEWLVAEMEKGHHSEKVATDLRIATLRLASQHAPDTAEHKALMAALTTAGQWDDPVFESAMGMLKGREKGFQNALGILTRIAKWNVAGPTPSMGMQGNGAALSLSAKEGSGWWSVTVSVLGRSADTFKVYVEATAPSQQYPGYRPMTTVARGGLRDLNDPKGLLKGAGAPLELIMRGQSRYATNEEDTLRRQVVKLAYGMPAGSPERRKLLSQLANTSPDTQPLDSFAKTARGRGWDKTVVGEHVRIRWSLGQNTMLIEELPGRPFKRQLRSARFPISTTVPDFNYIPNPLLMATLVRSARFSESMNFDRAVLAMQAAIDLAITQVREDPQLGQFWNGRYDWAVDALQKLPSENEVFYLEVEPGDYTEIKARGKDFYVAAEWTEFRMYDDSGDSNPSEGMREFYKEKSSGGARKFYKLVSALYKSGQLSGMSSSDFRKMLDKNKVAYTWVPTVWR